ncbi:MAG: flavodoxin domain-containing protein [Candidatus Kerfeldbacteria bacterium]|nr:flavodoxin domain-containing protein [Candidatus Kerfeldbacteria bacterium]
MKVVLVYDSVFGNTSKIAHAIYGALGKTAKIIKAWEFQPAMIQSADLVVMGSPINVWRPTKNMLEVFVKLKGVDLSGIAVATFDSRYDKWWAGTACTRIAHELQSHGAELIAKPEHFIVLGHEGPLRNGEEERAKAWGASLIQKVSTRTPRA